MKIRLFFISIVLLLTVTSCSTSNLLSAFSPVPSVTNVSGTSGEIVNVLTGVLGLSSNQQTSVGSTLTNYITGTNSIAPLANTDKASYITKLAGLNTSALGGIKNTLTAAQYAKLLGIGGSMPSTNSIASSIAGGSSLSPSALSVLSGLLMKK